MFLTADEIHVLTGRVRPSAQVRWLRQHGYRHTVNALGSPVVAVAEANRKLVGGVRSAQEPNWEGLKGHSGKAA
jgi:hypothetical protein